MEVLTVQFAPTSCDMLSQDKIFYSAPCFEKWGLCSSLSAKDQILDVYEGRKRQSCFCACHGA